MLANLPAEKPPYQYRITDPERSIPFYRDVLGLRRVMTLNNGPCTVYYMGYYYPGETTGADVFKRMQQRDGLLELVHIHGSHGRAVDNGNPPGGFGFGHIGISVPDIDAARKRFIEHGVTIWKDLGIEHSDRRGMTLAEEDGEGAELTEGFKKVFSRMMMIRDPDGEWGRLRGVGRRASLTVT
jgi:lactoylglutathione lyase